MDTKMSEPRSYTAHASNKLYHFKRQKAAQTFNTSPKFRKQSPPFFKVSTAWMEGVFQKECLTWWKLVRPTRARPFACPDFDFQQCPLPLRGGRKKEQNALTLALREKNPTPSFPLSLGRVNRAQAAQARSTRKINCGSLEDFHLPLL